MTPRHQFQRQAAIEQLNKELQEIMKPIPMQEIENNCFSPVVDIKKPKV